MTEDQAKAREAIKHQLAVTSSVGDLRAESEWTVSHRRGASWGTPGELQGSQLYRKQGERQLVTRYEGSGCIPRAP